MISCHSISTGKRKQRSERRTDLADSGILFVPRSTHIFKQKKHVPECSICLAIKKLSMNPKSLEKIYNLFFDHSVLGNPVIKR